MAWGEEQDQVALGREKDLWQEWAVVDQDMATPSRCPRAAVGQLPGGGAGDEAGSSAAMLIGL